MVRDRHVDQRVHAHDGVERAVAERHRGDVCLDETRVRRQPLDPRELNARQIDTDHMMISGEVACDRNARPAPEIKDPPAGRHEFPHPIEPRQPQRCTDATSIVLIDA